jgi:ribonuclease-3
VTNPPALDLAQLRSRLAVQLDDAVLQRSLTHRSFAYERGGLPTNERLEFLGDAVLGVVVTEDLFRRHPDLPEGQLAKLRAAVVNMRSLADVGRGVGLGEFLLLGRGEEATGGRDKSSILADALEAIIGAAYLEHGLEGARTLVRSLLGSRIAVAETLGAGLDWKTSLQEMSSAHGLGVPDYTIVESGPDHAKTFTAEVRLAGEPWGTGLGRSKKEAEQGAARTAWHAVSGRPATAGLDPAEAALDVPATAAEPPAR